MLVAAAPGLGANAPAQNDAGSGGDAADDAGSATLLNGPGSYEGNLTPPDDRDWYRFHGPSVSSGTELATCVEATVSGRALANVTLLPDGPGSPAAATHAVRGPVVPSQGLTLATATLVPGDPHLGLEPLHLPANGTAVSAGSYDIQLDTLTVNDVSDGSDLKHRTLFHAATGTAMDVPGACFGGTLDSVDPVDTYELTADAGQFIVLSYADDEEDDHVHGTFTLTDPDGTVVEEIGAGDIARVPVNTSGRWTLTATTDSASLTYVSGVSLFDEWPPCRPDC